MFQRHNHSEAPVETGQSPLRAASRPLNAPKIPQLQRCSVTVGDASPSGAYSAFFIGVDTACEHNVFELINRRLLFSPSCKLQTLILRLVPTCSLS